MIILEMFTSYMFLCMKTKEIYICTTLLEIISPVPICLYKPQSRVKRESKSWAYCNALRLPGVLWR